MAVAKVSEIIASSRKGFDDAVKIGIRRASKTLKNITGAWVEKHKVAVVNNRITEYRVNMKVTFVLE